MLKSLPISKFQLGIHLSLLSASSVLSIAVTNPDIPTLTSYRVQGFDSSSYGSDISSTATRFEVEHDELPLLLNVVSEHLLDEQQAIDPSDAFKNISSVQAEVATSGQTNQVSIRGFNSFTFIDGFRVGNSNSSGLGAVSFATEVANLERIEVLKGPAATLYGRGLPGGVINYITKKPQAETATELSAQFGSFGLLRGTVDTTGAVTVNDALRYRLIGSASSRESHRDQVKQEAHALYPSLQWWINEDTSLQLRTEYQAVDYTPDQGSLFLIDGSEADVSSRSFFYGQNSDQIETEQAGIHAQLENKISEPHTVRALVGYRHAHQSGSATQGSYVDSNTLERVVKSIDDERTDSLLQLDYIFEFEHRWFDTHELSHQLLLSANWQRNETSTNSSETPLDIVDLQNGARLGPHVFAGPPNNFDLIATDMGIGLQDLIQINERLHLLLGLRYDETSLDFDLDPFPFNDQVSLSDWSYRGGIIYEIRDGLSLFFSHSTAFTPALRISSMGESLFDLQQSIQYEVGLKLSLYDGHLNFDAAIFDLTNKDVIIADSMDIPVSTDQAARGVDIDVTARLSNRTTLLFNYALIETEYSDGPFQGNDLAGVPTQSAGIWLNHDLIAHEDQALSLSFGMNYKNSTYATDANNVQLPASLIFDAGLSYRRGPWQLRINAYNLSNEEAFVTTPNQDIGNPNAPIFALPIAPSNYRVSLSYRF